MLRSDSDEFLATSLDGFVTLRENDELMDAMAPGRLPYKDEDGLFDSESGDDANAGPLGVRGGGLLSRLGFGRKEGTDDDGDSLPDGSDADGKQPAETPRSSSDRESDDRSQSNDDGSEIVLSDVSETYSHILFTEKTNPNPQGAPPKRSRENRSPPLNPTFHCGLEVKTIVSKKLTRKFDMVKHVCGDFSLCDFGDNNFQLLVWDPKYRTQLLHHATVVDLDYMLFVVASETTIRYATLVYIPETKQTTYREILRGIYERSMKWVYVPIVTNQKFRIPYFRESAVSSSSYPVDSLSLCFNIFLWKKLIAMVSRLRYCHGVMLSNQH